MSYCSLEEAWGVNGLAGDGSPYTAAPPRSSATPEAQVRRRRRRATPRRPRRGRSSSSSSSSSSRQRHGKHVADGASDLTALPAPPPSHGEESTESGDDLPGGMADHSDVDPDDAFFEESVVETNGGGLANAAAHGRAFSRSMDTLQELSLIHI